MSIANRVGFSTDGYFKFATRVLAFLLVSISVFPILYTLLMTFRPANEFYSNSVQLFPHQPTFENWIFAFSELSDALVNSFIIASGTTALSLLIIVPGAYVFGRKQFPGKTSFFYIIIVALMFPYILLIVPIADFWYTIGLYDTIPGMWISYQLFVAPFAIWILRDYFAKLPKNIEESAQMYGCTQFSAFVRVILPIAAPAIVAIAFLSFLTAWNDFLMSSMLTTGTGPRPAVVELFITVAGGDTSDWGLITTETLIIGIPPTVLYLWARNYLSESFEMT
ncbi:carbohydrate ABC transporter permease [Halocatena marina]|uniref:Carbohydrate ABC transporter permease n=1 Tax=Halocatena marina TaxID=2934937 RepID=A0ABD5YNG9_9EURY|nr:carbohydrate ABC transporter permease [Halocatena marina]